MHFFLKVRIFQIFAISIINCICLFQKRFYLSLLKALYIFWGKVTKSFPSNLYLISLVFFGELMLILAWYWDNVWTWDFFFFFFLPVENCRDFQTKDARFSFNIRYFKASVLNILGKNYLKHLVQSFQRKDDVCSTGKIRTWHNIVLVNLGWPLVVKIISSILKGVFEGGFAYY